MSKLMDEMISNFIKKKSYGYEDIELNYNRDSQILGTGPITFLEIIKNQKPDLSSYKKHRRYYLRHKERISKRQEKYREDKRKKKNKKTAKSFSVFYVNTLPISQK